MDFLERTRLLVQAWEEKSITNDIVFSLVMKNKSICRRLIQRALPEVEVGELIYVNQQQDVRSSISSKEISYDLYVIDEHEQSFVLEMQVKNRHDLPLRLRYYEERMDQLILKPSDDYIKLADHPTYVIFFCQFDYYGEGLAKYEVEPLVKPTYEIAGKRQHNVIFNSKAEDYSTAGEIGTFLDLMEGKLHTGDKLIAEIDQEIKNVKTSEEGWYKFMLLAARIREERADAMEEGKKNNTISFVKGMINHHYPEDQIVKLLADTQGLTHDEVQTFYHSVLNDLK